MSFFYEDCFPYAFPSASQSFPTFPVHSYPTIYGHGKDLVFSSPSHTLLSLIILNLTFLLIFHNWIAQTLLLNHQIHQLLFLLEYLTGTEPDQRSFKTFTLRSHQLLLVNPQVLVIL